MDMRLRLLKQQLLYFFIFAAMNLSANAPIVHRVRNNEFIGYIANRYGVEIDDIVAMNNMVQADMIRPGEVLIVPPVNSFVRYTLSSNDTLDTIIAKYNVRREVVLNINHLSCRSLIPEGNTLTIPLRQFYTNHGNRYDMLKNLEHDSEGTFYMSGPDDQNMVALTFDDGPDREFTIRVLDVLKSKNVKATFFVLGDRVYRYRTLVRRIVSEGHLLSSHSWSHPYFTRLTEHELCEEVKKTEDAIFNVTGLRTAMIRPPYGAVSAPVVTTLKGMGYKVIHWSADSFDWRDRQVDQILINTLPSIGNGSIVLFHTGGGDPNNGRSATVEALGELIDTLHYRGFRFVTVDEMLGCPGYMN